MPRIPMESLPSLFEFTSSLPVAVIATDIGGIVTAWSPYAETLYGWTAAETLGTSVMSLTVGPTEQTVAEAIMARLVKGEPWQGEFTATRKDGSPVDVHVIDVPLFDDAGAIAGIVGLSIDVTEARDSLATVIDTLRTDVFLGGRVRAHERRRMIAELEDDLGARLSAAREVAATLAAGAADPAAIERLGALLRESEAALDTIRTRLARPLDADAEPHRIAEDQLADIVVAAGLVARIYVRAPLAVPSPVLAELLRAADVTFAGPREPLPAEPIPIGVGTADGVAWLAIGPFARTVEPGSRRTPPVPVAVVAGADLRERIAVALGTERDITVVGQAASAEEARGLAGLHPRVVAIEPPAGTTTGEAATAIARSLPGAAVIVLAPNGEAPDTEALLASGVRGILPAVASQDLVAAAIRCITRDGRYVAIPLGGPPGRAPAEPLTPREEEVVRRVVRGERVGEIADALGIDIRTVSTHKMRAQAKLGVASTAALVVRALELGLD